MKGVKRPLLLLIAVIQACHAIKMVRTSGPGPEADNDGCIDQVVMVEEESATRVP